MKNNPHPNQFDIKKHLASTVNKPQASNEYDRRSLDYGLVRNVTEITICNTSGTVNYKVKAPW